MTIAQNDLTLEILSQTIQTTFFIELTYNLGDIATWFFSEDHKKKVPFSREYRGKLIKMSTMWLSCCKKKGKGVPNNIFGGIFRKIRPNYSIHAKINLYKRNLNFAPPHHFQHSATPRFAMHSDRDGP